MPISAPKKVIDQEGRSNRVDVGTSKLHFFLILSYSYLYCTLSRNLGDSYTC